MLNRARLGVSAAAAVCLAAGAQAPSASASSLPTLTTAHQAHSLAVEQAARAYPVHLRAVVTYYDPFIGSDAGGMFVCDNSGCIYVSVPLNPMLAVHPGDMVDITGVSGPGNYAPIVTGNRVQFVAKSHLPGKALRVILSHMITGAFDGQWIEIEGQVRNVHLRPHSVGVDVAAEGGSFTAITVRQPDVDYSVLVDSRVRIRGNAGPVFNQNRQMVGVHVYFSSLRELRVIQAEPRDPFAKPVVPVSNLFLYSPDSGLLHRVHVKGTVTLDWPGHLLCIQDAVDGICMQTAELDPIAAGAVVDVVGFPAINVFKPTLEDVVFRTAATPAANVVPVPIADLEGKLDGRLIQVDGDLIGVDSSGAGLLLRAGPLLFSVILPPRSSAGKALPWKEGSRLRITGVCSLDILSTNMGEGEAQLQSARILLRSPADVAVLHAPSWWTPRHTLESFSLGGMVILAAFAWIAVLRYRVKQQTRALRLSEERLRHLSQHDALTGLPNRLLLNDRLQNAHKRAQRFQTYLGLLLVDVDEFKHVNDAYGHPVGDRLLCELARRFNACVRATDTVARMGGDEFIVLLPDLHKAAEAETIAAKIIDAIARPISIDQNQIAITVSIGVATYPPVGPDTESLLRCADEAMYAAKEKGKNRFGVYVPKTAELSDIPDQVLK